MVTSETLVLPKEAFKLRTLSKICPSAVMSLRLYRRFARDATGKCNHKAPKKDIQHEGAKTQREL